VSGLLILLTTYPNSSLLTESLAALASTWSADSNLSASGLSGEGKKSAVGLIKWLINGSDDQLILFCWVLNVSDNPFPVDIGKSMTVGHLKKAIKKEKEHTFAGVEPDTLELWKVSEIFPVQVDVI
jgi:hypothetical protein